MKRKYNRLKIILVEKDKTGKWLSDHIDKDVSTISRWCTNDMQPTIQTLFKIAEILNISPKELLNDK